MLVADLFKMFDRDGDGFLNREDLRLSYLDIIGKSMSQQEVSIARSSPSLS